MEGKKPGTIIYKIISKHYIKLLIQLPAAWFINYKLYKSVNTFLQMIGIKLFQIREMSF